MGSTSLVLNHGTLGRQSMLRLVCSQSLLALFVDIQFLLLFTAMVLYLFGFGVPYTHLPQYAMDRGTPAVKASGLMSIVGICNAIGRVILSHLGDRVRGGYLRVFTGTVATLFMCALEMIYRHTPRSRRGLCMGISGGLRVPSADG